MKQTYVCQALKHHLSSPLSFSNIGCICSRLQLQGLVTPHFSGTIINPKWFSESAKKEETQLATTLYDQCNQAYNVSLYIRLPPTKSDLS